MPTHWTWTLDKINKAGYTATDVSGSAISLIPAARLCACVYMCVSVCVRVCVFRYP